MEFQTGYYSRNYALPPTLFSLDSQLQNGPICPPLLPPPVSPMERERTFLSTVEKKKDRKDTAMSNVAFNLGLRENTWKMKHLNFRIVEGDMFFKKLILSALHLFLSVSIVSLT